MQDDTAAPIATLWCPTCQIGAQVGTHCGHCLAADKGLSALAPNPDPTATRCALGHPLAMHGGCFTCNPIRTKCMRCGEDSPQHTPLCPTCAAAPSREQPTREDVKAALAEADELHYLPSKRASQEQGAAVQRCTNCGSEVPQFQDWTDPIRRCPNCPTSQEQEPQERCVSGCDYPVTHHDADGVPLCTACWHNLSDAERAGHEP